MNREGLTIKMDREALLKAARLPLLAKDQMKDQMWKHVSELQETRRKPIPWMYLRLSASRAISVPTLGLARARNAALQAELFRIFTNNAPSQAAEKMTEDVPFLLMERAWPRPQDENGQ
jgi:hypothetical protein